MAQVYLGSCPSCMLNVLAVPSAGPRPMSRVLSREDVRDELRHFLWDTYGQEIQELGKRVQTDIKEEFRRFLQEQTLNKDCACAHRHVEYQEKSFAIVNSVNSCTGGSSLAHPGAKDGAPYLAWTRDERASEEVIELNDKSSEHGDVPTPRLPGLAEHSSALFKVIDVPVKRVRISDRPADPNGVRPFDSEAQSESAGLKFSARDSESTFPVVAAASSTSTHTKERESKEIDRNYVSTMGVNSANMKAFRRARESLQSALPVQSWQTLERMVKHEWFDYIMGIFLILNAIAIGVQADLMAAPDKEQVPIYFRAIDLTFCVIFVFELCARILVYRGRLYRMPGWQWNVFDTLIVTFQIIDAITFLVLSGTSTQEVVDQFGIMRILRLGRVIRLIRMVRLIPELKSMVYLISASMWSFFWTLMLLVLLMYCFAVFYTEHASDLAKENEGQVADDIRVHWGSIAKSMLSLYQAITGGDDWGNFVKVLKVASSDSSYMLNTFIFSAYIAFAILVMLNLVTGVFVEGAQRIIKEDKDNEMIRHVCRIFEAADIDGSSCISYDEFQAQIDSNRMDDYFKAVDLNKNDARHLFNLLDVDRSGSLSVEEFVRGTMRLKGPARSVDLAALAYDVNENLASMRNVQAKIASACKTLVKQNRSP